MRLEEGDMFRYLLCRRLLWHCGPVPQDADPPSRVARLNLLSGSVSFRPGSVEDWTAATLNYPLTTGDHLWADNDSRTEMHVGSTAIRMSSADRDRDSESRRSDDAAQLDGGRAEHPRPQLADDESFEIDTPNVAITLLRPGDYRVEADGENNVTTVTVHAGDAEVRRAAPFRSTHGKANAPWDRQRGGGARPRCRHDEFDQWCQQRDRHEDEVQVSARYVPRDMAGYEDLDDNGAWSEVPGLRLGVAAAPVARIGRRIATGTGPGSSRGAGPGSTMRRGASRRSTMAGGRWSAAAGYGRRGGWWRSAAGVCAGAGGVRRRRRRGRGGVVPAGSAGGVPAGVSRERGLRAAGQCHARDQRQRDERDVREPTDPGRGDGGDARDVCVGAARRAVGGGGGCACGRAGAGAGHYGVYCAAAGERDG